MSGSGFSAGDDDDSPLMPHKPIHDEAKFDITAMIDLVFMMNIFFLVTSVTAALAEVDLPTARRVAPSDRDNSVLITILGNADPNSVRVYDGESGDGKPIPEVGMEKRIRELAEAGVREQKPTILIKAEKTVRLRDLSRVASVASAVPGTELKVAVVEQE
ncbi:MAG TPA: hypothetical protein DDY91_21535 [Planctomycetaceae bacterium]|nr:hypothetical protein [Planctomycetaceae bacterium]